MRAKVALNTGLGIHHGHSLLEHAASTGAVRWHWPLELVFQPSLLGVPVNVRGFRPDTLFGCGSLTSTNAAHLKWRLGEVVVCCGHCECFALRVMNACCCGAATRHAQTLISDTKGSELDLLQTACASPSGNPRKMQSTHGSLVVRWRQRRISGFVSNGGTKPSL